MTAPYEFNICTRIVYGRNAAAQMTQSILNIIDKFYAEQLANDE